MDRVNITVYRHAQSKANAGEATDGTSGITLTSLGLEQAELLARRFEKAPSRIVTSSYIRTSETADPTRSRFPDVPSEEWPIHEFTYLMEAPLMGTTRADREGVVRAFWVRNDPNHRDGVGAESLQDLFDRVQVMVDRIEREAADLDGAAFFSHGMFMRAIFWCLLTNSYRTSPSIMKSFEQFCFTLPFPNTVAMPLIFTGNRWYVGTFSITHLPNDMVTT